MNATAPTTDIATSRPTHAGQAVWLTVIMLLALLAATPAQACNVPVFRYAIERWPASPYRVLVVHRGPLTTEATQTVAALEAASSQANLQVQTIDLAHQPLPEPINPSVLRDAQLPQLLVQYPEESKAPQALAWSGPLTPENAAALVDSPARRKIAQGLLAGDAAVWVMIDAGETGFDDVAATELRQLLDSFQASSVTQVRSNMDLPDAPPTGDPAVDGVGDLTKLAVSYSIVRISRDDPQEAVFLSMLLNSEKGLSDIEQTMAIPVFGRGRALYALVGRGISRKHVGAACAFLSGPCSCQVKDLNPGVDLLMAANWTEGLEGDRYVQDAATPLPSFGDLMAEAQAAGVVGHDHQDEGIPASVYDTSAPAPESGDSSEARGDATSAKAATPSDGPATDAGPVSPTMAPPAVSTGANAQPSIGRNVLLLAVAGFIAIGLATFVLVRFSGAHSA